MSKTISAETFSKLTRFGRLITVFNWGRNLSAGNFGGSLYLLYWVASRIAVRLDTLNGVSFNLPVRRRNKKFVVPLRLKSSDLFILKENLIDNQYDSDLLPRNASRIIDLGANAGYSMLALFIRYPNAQFVCLEPEAGNLKSLQKLIAMNEIPCRVICGALTAVDGIVSLGISEHSSAHRLSDKLGDSKLEVLVEGISLSTLLKRAGWKGADILKIDIEGAEEQLLPHSAKAFDSIDAILIELHYWIDVKEVMANFSLAGFALTQIKPELGEQVFIGIKNQIDKHEDIA